jgi:hypothetical protein
MRSASEQAHAHTSPDHLHDDEHGGHGHSHGLVDRSIVRSRAGVKAVSLSLAILGAAALVQVVISCSRTRSRCWRI